MPHPVLFMIQHLHAGGTEDHFYELVTGLDRAVIEPHVFHFNDHDGAIAHKLAAEPWLKKNFLQVHRAYDLSGLRAIWHVRRYLRQERNARERIAAVVTFHFVADFIGTLAAWGGPPVISSRRDMGFTRTPRQVALGRRLSRGVARYIAVSEAVRQAVARDETVDPARISVIHNGIDMDETARSRWDPQIERAKHSIAPDEIVIGCVANFNPVKGHLDLLDAFARLRRLYPDAPLRLLLAGEGPLQGAIEARIAELDLKPSVLLVGHSPAVAREFQMSDIVALASETEGFSNSIVQAMALARPVVACRVGGNPEAINEGESGYLVEPKKPAQLAEALARLVKDPDLRHRMGLNARRAAREQFTKKTMLEKTQQLILDVIAGQGK